MSIYLLRGEQQTGPHTESEVRAMLASAEISRDTLAWREGLSKWQPVEALITVPGLPPLPAKLPPVLPKPENRRPLHTASGIIALILALLAVFNIGGCINAQQKLERFQSGSDPYTGVEMMVETFRGANEGDPLRGISGLLDKSQSLNEDLENSQVGAWLCLIGAAISGVVFLRSKPSHRVA